MKRIIDIDEDYYENLKYNVEQGQKYKPWEIIVNSTPYEERPQGEWIYFLGCGVGRAMCSECGQLGDIKKYCGYCGAKMKLG